MLKHLGPERADGIARQLLLGAMPPAAPLPRMHMTPAEIARIDKLRLGGKSPQEKFGEYTTRCLSGGAAWPSLVGTAATGAAGAAAIGGPPGGPGAAATAPGAGAAMAQGKQWRGTLRLNHMSCAPAQYKRSFTPQNVCKLAAASLLLQESCSCCRKTNLHAPQRVQNGHGVHILPLPD